MNKKLISVPFELKELSDSGEFTGVASPYAVLDLGNDVVDQGAFTKTIAERGNKVRLLDGHEVRIGIAAVVDAGSALEAKGRINLDKQAGRDAYSDLKFYRDQGLPMGLSIGYETVKSEVGEDKARHLKEVRLWEISITEFPMNESALITSVKSAAGVPAEKQPFNIQNWREKTLMAKSLRAAQTTASGKESIKAVARKLKEVRHKLAELTHKSETKSADVMDACQALCRICSDVCSSCIYYCWDVGGDMSRQEHIAAMADCGSCCDFCCSAMYRDSASLPEICALCEVVCRRCATACTLFSEDAVMVACAATCNACADCCATMTAGGMESMAHTVSEVKAGRRLSSATMETMKSAHEHIKSASDILLALLEDEADGEDDVTSEEKAANRRNSEPVEDHSAAQSLVEEIRSLIPVA